MFKTDYSLYLTLIVGLSETCNAGLSSPSSSSSSDDLRFPLCSLAAKKSGRTSTPLSKLLFLECSEFLLLLLFSSLLFGSPTSDTSSSLWALLKRLWRRLAGELGRGTCEGKAYRQTHY